MKPRTWESDLEFARIFCHDDSTGREYTYTKEDIRNGNLNEERVLGDLTIWGVLRYHFRALEAENVEQKKLIAKQEKQTP